MNVSSINIVILLIVSLTGCQAQLHCYICNTQTGLNPEKCGDGFRWTPNDAVKCAFETNSCQKTRGHRNQGGRNVVEITRACVPNQQEGCRTGTHDGITAEICICNTDACNKANSVIFSSWGLAMSGILTVMNLSQTLRLWSNTH